MGRQGFVATWLPVAALVGSIVVVTWFAREILQSAHEQEVEIPGLLPLFCAVLGLSILSTVLVFLQAARSARRLNGPVQRINVAMQRVRQGDIAHRVHLRRHDELRGVASELNMLLDWLNDNPPEGVLTGGDVVEIDLNQQDPIDEEFEFIEGGGR